MSGLEVRPEALRVAAGRQRVVAAQIAASAQEPSGGADVHGVGSAEVLAALDGFTTRLDQVLKALSTAATASGTALDLAASHYAALDRQVGAGLVTVPGRRAE